MDECLTALAAGIEGFLVACDGLATVEADEYDPALVRRLISSLGDTQQVLTNLRVTIGLAKTPTEAAAALDATRRRQAGREAIRRREG